VYGKDAVSLSSCQRWVEKFRSGNLSVNNSSRTGRPTDIETDKIKVLLDENLYLKARDIADVFRSHTQVFLTIFIRLVIIVDSTLGYRTP